MEHLAIVSPLQHVIASDSWAHDATIACMKTVDHAIKTVPMLLRGAFMTLMERTTSQCPRVI